MHLHCTIAVLLTSAWIACGGDLPDDGKDFNFHGVAYKLQIERITKEEQQRMLHKATNSTPLRKGETITAPNRIYRLTTGSGNTTPQMTVWERKLVVTEDKPSSKELEDKILVSSALGLTQYPPRLLDVRIESAKKECIVIYQRLQRVWADVVSLTNATAPVHRLKHPDDQLCSQDYLEPPSSVESAEIGLGDARGRYTVQLKFTSGQSTNYVFDGTKWQPASVKP